MANDDTGISKIDQHGDHLRVQGRHEGVPSDYKVPMQHVDQIRKEEGEKGVRAYLERNLRGGRIDQRFDLTP